MRPHPLTKHLSLLHTSSLFPVCSILLLLSGKLLKPPVDTASSTTPALEEGGYPTVPDARIETTGPPSTCLGWGEFLSFVYLVSNFPTTFDKVSNFISSYTALPFTRTASYQSEIPTVLKKRDAHGLKLKENGVHLRTVRGKYWRNVDISTQACGSYLMIMQWF